MLAVDVAGVKAFIVAALEGVLIFAFIRVGSEENPMWERPKGVHPLRIALASASARRQPSG